MPSRTEADVLRPAIVVVWFALAVVVASGIHLVHPDRVVNQHSAPIAGPLSYAFNVDSAKFAYLVVTFPSGLNDDEGRVRQMRPLYVALAWVPYVVLRPIGGWLPEGFVGRVRKLILENEDVAYWSNLRPRDLVIAWGCLIAVNMVLFWLSLMLAHGLWSLLFPGRMALLLPLVAAAHSNAIDFVLVPHTEVFNLLGPALFLAALRQWLLHRPDRLFLLALGWVQLGKGVPYLAGNWLYHRLRPGLSFRSARAAASVIILVAGPTAMFLVFLLALGIHPYNHEISQYRQVVWILDYLREGAWARVPVRLGLGAFLHLRHTAVGFCAPLAMTLICLVLPRRVHLSHDRIVKEHMTLYVLECTGFWSVVGFLQARLAITEYPFVTYALGLVLCERTRRPSVWLGLVLVSQVVTFIAGLVH